MTPALTVNNLTIEDTLLFNGDAVLEYDPVGECLSVMPALCVTNLSISDTLSYGTGAPSPGSNQNPLTIGDVNLEGIGNETMCLDPGMLGLPLWINMDPSQQCPATPTPPMSAAFVTRPNPNGGSDPLLCLVTPNGTCLTEDLYFNETIHGKFCAQDFPTFPNGLDFGPAGFLAPNTTSPSNLLLVGFSNLTLCAPNDTLHVGCHEQHQQLALDGLLVTNVTMDLETCLQWSQVPLSGSHVNGHGGICGSSSSSSTPCLEVNAACFVFDGTEVSFTNGAQIEGDLWVTGNLIVNGTTSSALNLTFTNLYVANYTSIGGDLAVDEDVTIGGHLVVTSGLVTASATIGSNLLVSGTSQFQNLVTMNANVILTGASHTLSIQNGARTMFQSGSQFQSASGATATCAAPLFTQASGCVFSCPANPPDFTACSLTMGGGAVVGPLHIGQTGLGPMAATELEAGTRNNRVHHVELFGTAMEVGAVTSELLAQDRARTAARQLNVTHTVAIPSLTCDPDNPAAHPGPAFTGCANITRHYEMDSSEHLGGRTLTASMCVAETCLSPSAGIGAMCDADFITTPGFPMTRLIDGSTGTWVPDVPPFVSSETFTVLDGAWLDLQACEGRAELVATERIDIGTDRTISWVGTDSGSGTTSAPPLIVFSGTVLGIARSDTWRFAPVSGSSFPVAISGSGGSLAPTLLSNPGSSSHQNAPLSSAALPAGSFTLPPYVGMYQITLALDFTTLTSGTFGIRLEQGLSGRVATVCQGQADQLLALTASLSPMAWACSFSTMVRQPSEILTLTFWHSSGSPQTIDHASKQTYLELVFVS